MFSKLALFAATSMAVFVAALPTPGGIDDSCNGGKIYCCNDVQPATSSAAQQQIGGLAGILAPITGTVGLTCDPISVLALGGQSCTSQQTCCSGNSFSGLVVVGCSPINL